MPTRLILNQHHLTRAIYLSLTLLLLCTIPALAQATTGTVNANANLRAGPGTTYPIVGKATIGQQLTITSQNTDHDWYQLANGQWIAGFLVDLTETTNISATTTAPAATPQAAPVPTGPTATTTANLRAGPGTTYPIIGSTTEGQTLEITGRTADNIWLKLATGAWIYAQLVNNIPADLAVADAPTIESTVSAQASQPVSTQPTQAQPANCDSSYPDVCIPPYPPDLDCDEIPYRRFRVTGSDPHGFDRDNDGIGCERG